MGRKPISIEATGNGIQPLAVNLRANGIPVRHNEMDALGIEVGHRWERPVSPGATDLEIVAAV